MAETMCTECQLPTTDELMYRGRPCHILCMERAERREMDALMARRSPVSRPTRPTEGREVRGRMTDRGEDN